MSETEVVELMKSSNSPQEWDANCDKVKAAFGGYPSFWFPEVIASGLLMQQSVRWEMRGAACSPPC